MIINDKIKDTVEIRKSCVDEIIKVAQNDSSICFVETDLASSSGSSSFGKQYPDRFFNIGIMEAEAVSVAAGLAVTGMKPFVHSFAPFAARRCFDQAVVSSAYADLPMVILGSDPGITTAYNGGTHTTFEDIAMFRALSNTRVFDVCDSEQMRKVISLIIKDFKGLNYIRFSRRPSYKIYSDAMEFTIGKGVEVREGKDICIFTSGAMVSQAIDAADILSKEGKTVRIIDLFTIHPIDEEIIIKAAKECSVLVSLDNHNVRGGLGSAVAEVLTSHLPKKLHRIGATTFGQVGTYDQLLELYGWTGEQLAKTIKSFGA
ncbi:MAG: transketolase family protein [Brevinema sp.]